MNRTIYDARPWLWTMAKGLAYQKHGWSMSELIGRLLAAFVAGKVEL